MKKSSKFIRIKSSYRDFKVFLSFSILLTLVWLCLLSRIVKESSRYYVITWGEGVVEGEGEGWWGVSPCLRFIQIQEIFQTGWLHEGLGGGGIRHFWLLDTP